jgi:hypothetical protein
MLCHEFLHSPLPDGLESWIIPLLAWCNILIMDSFPGETLLAGDTTGSVGKQCLNICVSGESQRGIKEDHHGLQNVCCDDELSAMVPRASEITGRCFHFTLCLSWFSSCTKFLKWPAAGLIHAPVTDRGAMRPHRALHNACSTQTAL